jgi:hypothetical protein
VLGPFINIHQNSPLFPTILTLYLPLARRFGSKRTPRGLNSVCPPSKVVWDGECFRLGREIPKGYQYTVLRHEKLCQTEMPAGQAQKVTKLPPTEAVFKGCAKELPACFKEVEEEYRSAAKYDAEHVFLVSDLAKLTKVYINAEETTTVTFARLGELLGIINKTIRKGVESDDFQHNEFSRAHAVVESLEKSARA